MAKKMDLKHQELRKIADFLQKNYGISLDDSKIQRFKRKIEVVAEKRGVESFHAFYHQIRFVNNHEIIQELINAVTINETYFWRENRQFDLLVKNILPSFISSSFMNNVRILVAPCSSGEEVYSIMISIMEEKKIYENLNIEIMGIDIDSEAIKKAKIGIYSERSVGKLPHLLLKKYFDRIDSRYKINDMLRKNARFMQANILDSRISAALGKFDILFSRNMLIYFEDQEKQKTFKVFHSLLKDKGYLFLGHADANGIDEKLFSHIKEGNHIYMKKRIEHILY